MLRHIDNSVVAKHRGHREGLAVDHQLDHALLDKLPVDQLDRVVGHQVRDLLHNIGVLRCVMSSCLELPPRKLGQGVLRSSLEFSTL